MDHSLTVNHYLYLNTQSGICYRLPDNVIVDHNILNAIRNYLNPVYDKHELELLSSDFSRIETKTGLLYHPGLIGLNNLGGVGDGVNSVLQFLLRITPFRNALLTMKTPEGKLMDPLLVSLAHSFRRLCSRHNMKGIFTPHDFLQVISQLTDKKMGAGMMTDPAALLHFLMSYKGFKKLTSGEGEKRKKVLESCIQGEVKVGDGHKLIPLNILSLELPLTSTFKKSKNINMQNVTVTSLSSLLESKFNGECKLWSLPRYLIVHLKRFSKNQYHFEKNNSIVPIPVFEPINLSPYLHSQARDLNPITEYTAAAVIVHEKPFSSGGASCSCSPLDGHYKTFVGVTRTCFSENQENSTEDASNNTTEKQSGWRTCRWFECNDLYVNGVLSETIQQAEGYFILFERVDIRVDGSQNKELIRSTIQKQAAERAALSVEKEDDEEDIFANL